MKIAVVAPACALKRETADKVAALSASVFGARAPEIFFHPQCFESHGHFAGTDVSRGRAFLEVANDDGFDAVWFARGGYGSCRIDDSIFQKLNEAARKKTYLGYSDLGAMLARLYRDKVGRPVHGPMPSDINRKGGDAAVTRALKFLLNGDASTVEPAALKGASVAAFNIMILAHLMGTPHQPDLSGHVLMLEEISEYMYRIDRALFTITSNENIRRAAGIMLGRCSDIPANDPDFAQGEDAVVTYWCERAGLPYLGRADIGHDVENKVVPFGSNRCDTTYQN